jgi:transposase
VRRDVMLIRPRGMRGDERDQDGMFSYVSLEQRVPADHPLREVRKLTDMVLRSLSGELDALYAEGGRPSIAPEYILRALLLQVFFSIRSERLLVEQIDYNLLFRWFVGLGMDDGVWNHAVFSKNRDRLLNSEVAQRFFAEVNRQAKKFMSDEHFTVDGTLIQAWASQKSFRPGDGDGPGDGTNFHGQQRSNKTHESTTDPNQGVDSSSAFAAGVGAGEEIVIPAQHDNPQGTFGAVSVDLDASVVDATQEGTPARECVADWPQSLRTSDSRPSCLSSHACSSSMSAHAISVAKQERAPHPLSGVVGLLSYSSGRKNRCNDAAVTIKMMEPGAAVGLQDAAQSAQVYSGMFASAIRREGKPRRRWCAVGCGPVVAEFESPPPTETVPHLKMLTIRDEKAPRWANLVTWNSSLPYGAGLCVLRDVATEYAKQAVLDSRRKILGRQGQLLLSSEDVDLAFFACKLGLGTGVFPGLSLLHLIPSRRLDRKYLVRLAEGNAFSLLILAHLWGYDEEGKGNPWVGHLRDLKRLIALRGIERDLHIAKWRGKRMARRWLRDSSQPISTA